MGSLRTICIGVGLISLLAAAPASAVVSGSEAIAFLNAQRAANGIEPITEHPDLSQGCLNHMAYLEAHPGAPFFGEDPTQPEYSAVGAGDPSLPIYADGYIALHAVNSPEFSIETNPWERAPGHMAAAFDPTADSAGYGQTLASSGRIEHCMRLAGFSDRRRVTLEAFIAPQGLRDVPYSVTICCEGPLSPMEAAHLPNNIPTGPVITLYAYSPDRVPLKPVSQRLMRGKKVINGIRFLAGSEKSGDTRAAMHGPASALIPAQPLKPNRSYRALLKWRKGRRTFDQVVRFRTSTRTVR